jgi:predicted O-linked N-acetylglucosamine transferase (SPINDLY family)
LGFPGTSGTDLIDYIIAHKTLIPKENQKFFSEKIIYLPDSYQPNDYTKKMSKKVFTREELSLPKNAFVFCCFNQNYKITPNIFNIWMKILKKIEGSVLWLIKDSNEGVNNLKKEANKRGINPDKIIFAKRMTISEHLARHKMADLFIDTFPYTAHTTCSDALWSGLPVITLMGQSFASRLSGTLLNAVGLNELIATTEKDYEDLIINLAKDSNQLKIIKNKLEKNKINQPIFNTKLYTKKIESAYKEIYKRYHSDLPLENIEIE